MKKEEQAFIDYLDRFKGEVLSSNDKELIDRYGTNRGISSRRMEELIKQVLEEKPMSGMILSQTELSALQKFAAQQQSNAEFALLEAELNNAIAGHQIEMLRGIVGQLHQAQQLEGQALSVQASVEAKLKHGQSLKGYIASFLLGGE